MSSQYNVSIKGIRQGDFKGDVSSHESKSSGRHPILGLSFAVISPRDASSGLATGQRTYHPVTIYKEWGNLSAQLIEALNNNETLPTVVIQETRQNPAGQEFVYMEVRLINAAISAISVDAERLGEHPVWTKKEIEQISFVFQQIEIENFSSHTVTTDEWHSLP